MISLAIVTISGEPGCSSEEVARLTAQRLQFELITESRLRTLIDQEFQDVSIPDRAYPQVAASLMAKLAVEYHLLINTIGAETYFRQLAGVLRIRVVAPESRRIGSLMVDRRLERPAARTLLGELESGYKAQRKRNFGRGVLRSDEFDITYNSGAIDSDQIARMIQVGSETLHLREHGLLSQAAEAQIQFQMRLNLSKHGIAPVSKVTLKHAIFSHPSEQIFANLLDFYRIAWDYEPKSFPISWDKDGKPLEFFTPDFYLPESDMYVELTTMKQANVTKKNRKVKLLRTIYPNVNIQVFYQKDFQNLIFKHGLAERTVQA